MPFVRTLLERLEKPSASADRDISTDTEELMGAIQRHLQQMLNCRHGNAQATPSYGIADFSALYRGQDTIEDIKQQIRECIARYEPRLAEAKVSFIPAEDDPFRLHFEIEAELSERVSDEPVVFRTVLEGSGEMKVFR